MSDKHEIRRGERVRATPAHTIGSSTPDTVTEAVAGLSQGMNALVRGHLALARVELSRDLKALGKDAGLALGGAPMLLVGYLLLWIGLGYLLALALPVWAAFLVCAGVNFAIGLALVFWGRQRLRHEKLALPATSTEVKRDRQWLGELREPTDTLRDQLH